MKSAEQIEARISQHHAAGIIDMHFDLPLGLFLELPARDVFARKFLPAMEAGNLGLVGVALYVEEKYLPAEALRVALAEITLLLAEIEKNPRLMLCKNFADIERAQNERRLGFILTMEGVEPLGTDLDLLRIFYQLGLRSLMLTHARVNAAGAGGIFAPSGSPPQGLSHFGRAVVQESRRLGILLDLAHLNAAGFDEACRLTSDPFIVSHSNARHFHDIERNISDEQIKMIGACGGVIGVNAVLVSATEENATVDRYVDHVEHVASLIGIDGVAIGFDFCDFIYAKLSAEERAEMEKKLTRPFCLRELNDHSQAKIVTRKLIERGFSDDDLAKFLRGNWLRVLEQTL